MSGDRRKERALGNLETAKYSAVNARHVEDRAVQRARAAGVTWTEIGVVYGMSRQGARRKFLLRLERDT